MINKCIYFDNNATTRTDPRVLEAMLPYFSEQYGNASSKLHPYGWVAQAAVEKSLEQMAALIGCDPDEIVLTSGATESVNLALFGLYESYKSRGNHIITVKTEHKAVLDCCEALKQKGAEITYLDVNREGKIDSDELKSNIRPKTILVSVMMANNETGVLQDLETISEICLHYNLLLFSDGTQFVGKQRSHVHESGIHALAFSAHKFYGPKGVGGLYIRKNKPSIVIRPQIHGGGHQHGKRSGTLNVPGIVGMGAAAAFALQDYWEDSSRISVLRNHFEHQLLEIEGIQINGSTRDRLYNTSNISFPKSMNVSSLNSKFAFSSGSACSSEDPRPSHVLSAMGIHESVIRNSFRFSLGRFSSIEEVDMLLTELKSKISNRMSGS